MVECENKMGFMYKIKDALSSIPNIISATIFPPIADGAERIMRTIEERIMHLKKRMLREISSLMIILFGGIFLVFSIFFFMIEYLGWSKTAAFFSIGITVFVIGLILKLTGSDK